MKAIRYNNPHDYEFLIKDLNLVDSINLTVSQTLCNAIISCCEFDDYEKKDNFITINSFIDLVYPKMKDVDRNLQKYNILSEMINSIIDMDLRRSLKSVKGEILQTIELLSILDISSVDFKDSLGSDKILNEVVKLILNVEKNHLFSVEKPDVGQLESSMKMFKRVNKIVYIHGVHQFSPIMLLTFEMLEKFDYEVVFIYNYNRDFPRIYSTWDRIYKKLNLTEINDYPPKEIVFENKHMNIPFYLEGKIGSIMKYAGLTLDEFTTITNLTEFVKKEYEFGTSERNKMIESEGDPGRSPVSYMNRQFYGINGAKSNTFLKIMYPEQFKERHFLSYPVGQFIMGLYSCWDRDLNDLIVSDSFIPVLAFDIWKSAPINIFRKLRFLYKEDLSLDQYMEKIIEMKQNILNMSLFITRYNNVFSIKEFNRIVYFNYTISDLEEYLLVLQEIKDLAINILGFGTDNFSIIKHMNKLIMFIETRKGSDAKADDQLLNILKEKIGDLSSRNISGSVEDLQESMFILYQASQSEGNANWIIRDFEQLDGEVFNKNTKNRIIHLTQLSDDDIDTSVKDSKLWPLDELIARSKLVNEKVLIYHTSKKEYANLLRFMLFYTVYFSRKDVELSYIGYSLGEKRTPFYFLNDIGYKIMKDESLGKLEMCPVNPSKNIIKDKICLLRKKLKELEPLSDYFDDEIQIQKFIQTMVQFTFSDYLISEKRNNPQLNFTDERIENYIDFFIKEFKPLLRRLLCEMPLNVFEDVYKKGFNWFKTYSLRHVKEIVCGHNIAETKLQYHNLYKENRLDRLYHDIKDSSNVEEDIVYVNRHHHSYAYICQNCSYRTSCMAGYMSLVNQ